MTSTNKSPAAATAPTDPAPAPFSPARQCEPKTGGSYTRIPATGALVKNEPPVPQSKQE